MNSTFLGYILFALAAYFLLIFGAPENEQSIKAMQHTFFSPVVERYIHIPGFLFVSTGVLASILISYTFKDVWRAFRSLSFIFFKNKVAFQNYINTIKSVSEYTQTRDIETLEEFANSIKYSFLRDGLLMLVNGYKKEEMEDILQARLENEMHREEVDDDVWRAAARYSPGYGMLGTTVGLIQMFSANIDAAKGFGPIIAAMSVAFTTTLYGLLFSNFIFQPIADKVERRNTEDALLKAMIIDGLGMIKDKKRPTYIEEKLNSYVPHSRSLTTTAQIAVLENIKK